MIVQTDPRAPRVVLVGPPGAGKSTIGRKLARELGVELYDTDAGIERETGRTIPEIFAEDGEPEFRRIEERVVRRAVLAERGVVSLGGGAVLSENTRALLRNRTVVYLEISVAEGLRRTGASTQRPLLNGADPGAKYRELMRTRRPLYREVATVRVRTDGRSPGRVVRMIMTRLGMEPAERAEADLRPPPSGIPQGSSRSRARRRARARATSRRKDADQGEPNDTAADPAPESAVAAVRSRRTRRSVTSEPDAATGAGSSEAAGSRSRRARSRRARSRARQQSTTASTESEQAT
ncbi:shikimate kinase [Nocardia abscessus]|uniref:shikimate kinase n=1 Tax=Nocardia abscessus TaxID=120957 RepID=UPI001893C33D|nr:shikimate kinase [Nocardia abscessus]